MCFISKEIVHCASKSFRRHIYICKLYVLIILAYGGGAHIRYGLAIKTDYLLPVRQMKRMFLENETRFEFTIYNFMQS